MDRQPQQTGTNPEHVPLIRASSHLKIPGPAAHTESDIHGIATFCAKLGKVESSSSLWPRFLLRNGQQLRWKAWLLSESIDVTYLFLTHVNNYVSVYLHHLGDVLHRPCDDMNIHYRPGGELWMTHPTFTQCTALHSSRAGAMCASTHSNSISWLTPAARPINGIYSSLF